MCHELLNIVAAKAYVPYQDLESKQMLHDLLQTPDDFLQHIRRYTFSVTTSLVFGTRAASYNSPEIQTFWKPFEEFLELNQAGTAGLVDFYPLLRKLPDFLLPTKREAKRLHKAERKLYEAKWLDAKRKIQDGTISHCFCVGMAKAQEKEGFSDAQAVSQPTRLLSAAMISLTLGI
jgi:hypothetical protein